METSSAPALYSMRSGKGLVEVRFSSSDSFDLKAQTATGIVDNQATAFLKPDSHGVKHIASKFTARSLRHRWHGPRESRTLLLQWYNPHHEARLILRASM